MNHAAAKERITKLKELINNYRYHYHVLNESIMSEEAADSLKHELSKLEEEYPDLLTSDSPSQRVAGEILKGFKSVEHRERMTSLADVFSIEEVEAWINRISKLTKDPKDLDYYVDIKMDGVALNLVYENGILVQGVTRGDGYKGEDVTANIRTLDSIPLTLRSTAKTKQYLLGRVDVRGEIIMYKKDFELLNIEQEKKGLPKFANPRNTTAGTIRQLDPRLVAKRKLYFRAYDIIFDPMIETNELVYSTLGELGFLVNKMSKKLKSISEIEDFINTWEEKRKSLEFNTDGLVLKVNDREVYKQLGIVGKAPRGAAAYKYAAEQSTTKVKDIFISIGRTGSATPVAILEPVQIAGTTVQMATLHNDQEIARKDIRIGDSVIVHKAGDIIPEIVEPLKTLRTGKEKIFKMPSACPDCGKSLAKVKEEDVVWRCVNNHCPSRTFKRIEHYASKTALDIEGLGEKNVIALLNAGLIDDQADIYQLEASEVSKLERFASLSAAKLVAAISEKKNPELARFIYGLGIRHVGVQTAIDLANNFHKLENLVKASSEELENVEGIGEVVAESIVEWFSEPSNIKLLEKFKQNGVVVKEARKLKGKLSGLSFVVTGTLKTMGREDAAELIRSNGGTFQSSVGNETDYLVTGENVGESKLIKARKLGTKVISETELLKLVS